MLRTFLFISSLVLAQFSVALADPAEDIQAAATKVQQSDNYSWHTVSSGHSVFVPPTAGPGQAVPQIWMPPRSWSETYDGKTRKDGLSIVTTTDKAGSVVAIIVGKYAVIKDGDQWKSADEVLSAISSQPEMAYPAHLQITIRYMAHWSQEFQTPAGLVLNDLKDMQNIQPADGGYTADLTPNADRHESSRTIQVWIRDGTLTEFEIHSVGEWASRSWNTTDSTELSGVGTTDIELPAEAKAKLESMNQ